MEPLLEAMSAFFDDRWDVAERVRRTVRGLKRPDSDRHGLTATQSLHSVLMRLKNWDYRELRERIADGLKLRQFTDFYYAPVPKHDDFISSAPTNAESGQRFDGSGSGLARIGGRREAAGRHDGGTDRNSSSEEVVENARAGLERTRTIRGEDLFLDMAIEELRGQIEHFCHLGVRVIDQARHGVLCGEQLATDEKIYSILEPHTDLIKRGKVRTPVEFGDKVLLAEGAAGLITQYEVLRGNPPDEVQLAFSLQRHRQSFGRAPQLYSSDRGYFSEQNLASCKHADVKVVCIP